MTVVRTRNNSVPLGRSGLDLVLLTGQQKSFTLICQHLNSNHNLYYSSTGHGYPCMVIHAGMGHLRSLSKQHSESPHQASRKVLGTKQLSTKLAASENHYCRLYVKEGARKKKMAGFPLVSHMPGGWWKLQECRPAGHSAVDSQETGLLVLAFLGPASQRGESKRQFKQKQYLKLSRKKATSPRQPKKSRTEPSKNQDLLTPLLKYITSSYTLPKSCFLLLSLKSRAESQSSPSIFPLQNQ